MTTVGEPSARPEAGADEYSRRRLPVVIVANALIRIAGGASGILVGLFFSAAANKGSSADAMFVGILGAASFGAELIASVPMGVLSDAIAPRWLMTGGALLAAAATQLFGLTGRSTIFLLSRGIEGVGTAASGPALLAHLTDVTGGNPGLRSRVMSFYELSFLAGIAVGGVVGSQLWRILNTGAFAAVAAIYVVAAAMLFTGAAHSRSYGSSAAIAGFFRALREPELRRLAPVWLCVNSIVGLWLGPTLAFLMTHSSPGSQFLAGIFADRPEKVGWLLLWYSLVFGIGVSAWSVVLPRMRPERALRIGLTAMPFVCVGLMALNHSGAVSTDWRWVMGVVTALLIMIESGFTPAALSLLAGAVGARSGRGAAMGIYSVLLSVGAIAGSLMAAFLGKLFLVDGLIYGTFGLAILALVLMRALHER